MNEIAVSQKSNYVYLILVLVYVFALTDRYMYMCIAITGFCFYLLAPRINASRRSLAFLLLIMAALSALCLIYSVAPGLSLYFSSSIAIKEIIRAIFYFLIIQIAMSFSIDVHYYTKLWKIVLYVVVGIAVLQYVKIFDIDSILKSIYGNKSQFYNTLYTDLSMFRSGSVFVNPNVLASFLVAVLASFLFLQRELNETWFARLLVYITFIVGFILTGSRTGLIAGVLIVILYMWYDAGKNFGAIIGKVFIVIFIGVIFLLLYSLINQNSTGLYESRIFQIREGSQSSFLIKMNTYFNLLTNMNPVNWIIGYGPYDYTSSVMLAVDFDFGYITTYYGIAGFIAFIQFIKRIISYRCEKIGIRQGLNYGFALVFFLFSITSGVYFNLRIFAIYVLLFLPMLHNDEDYIA